MASKISEDPRFIDNANLTQRTLPYFEVTGSHPHFLLLMMAVERHTLVR